MFTKYSEIRNFIGEKGVSAFWLTIIYSVLHFIIESTFIYVIQLFLYNLGLLKEVSSLVESLLKLSTFTTSMIVIGYSAVRSIVMAQKNYLACMVGQYFMAFQRLKFSKFSLQHPGELESASMIEVFSERISHAAICLEQFNGLLMSILMSFMFFSFSFYKTPIETILGLVTLLFFILPLGYMNNSVKKSGENSVKSWSNINNALMISILNGPLLKIYHLNKNWFEKISEGINTYLKTYSKYYIISSIRATVPLFLGMTVLVIVSLYSKHYTETRPEDLMVFFYIFIRMSQSISSAVNSFTNIKMNMPGLEKIHKLNIFINSKNQDWPIDEILEKQMTKKAELVLDRVSFGYISGKKVIENLSLNINVGEICLIKGESGSGKSTLVKLIVNELFPSDGEIKFSGDPIKKISKTYSGMLGYVGPKTNLISGTIREALLFANEDYAYITDDKIWAILKVVQLEGVIQDLPLKLDEKISEKLELSTGQLQRLGLAMALLRKPRILILDEATANLDSTTEANFIRSLNEIKDDKIIIAVTHRSGFDAYATKVLNL